jgi:hypothetical protein
VARLLGGEHLISREEVERLQGLRGLYGTPAPAPLCADPSEAGSDQVVCQVLEAPDSPEQRLVPDDSLAFRRDRGPDRARLRDQVRDQVEASRDGEIRLTYGELTALIADAVKTLKE